MVLPTEASDDDAKPGQHHTLVECEPATTLARAWERAAELVGLDIEPISQEAIRRATAQFHDASMETEEKENDKIIYGPDENEKADSMAPKDMEVELEMAAGSESPEVIVVEKMGDGMDTDPLDEAESSTAKQVFGDWERLYERPPANDESDDDSFACSDDETEKMDFEMIAVTRSDGVNVGRLSDILQRGNDAIQEIPEGADVVLLLGGSGAGKSTFIQAVSGRKFKQGWDEKIRQSCYIVDDMAEGEGFEIGHGLKSMTRHVRPYFRQETSTYYVDSSGFGDSEGIETDIATSICVRNIAARAGRLRFVVFIDTFQFYSGRASELKKNLDVISKFIGHNFGVHRKSFTFLFTKCFQALPNVRCRVEGSNDASGITSAMRTEILHLVKELHSTTTEVSLNGLTKVLLASLKKDLPYCDVFDPMYSKVESVCTKIEPASAKECITNPAEVVQCSLTAEAKMKLDHEVGQRMVAICNKLDSRVVDEVLVQDVVSIKTLDNYVGTLGSDLVDRLMVSMSVAFDQMKDELHQIVHRGTLSSLKTKTTFTSEDALQTKLLLGNISQLGNLLGLETEALSRLTVLLEDQVSWIEKEVGQIKEFTEGNMDMPSVKDIASQLRHLKVWSSVFATEVALLSDTAEASVCTCLEYAISTVDLLLDGHEGYDGHNCAQLARAVTLFKIVSDDGLMHLCFPDDGVNRWDQTYLALLKAMDKTIQGCKESVQPAITKLFSQCSTDLSVENLLSGHNEELISLLANVCQLQNTIQGESHLTQHNDLHQSVTAMAVADFDQRADICLKLIQSKSDYTADLLPLCFASLYFFVNSLPNPLISGLRFHSRLQNLQREIESYIETIIESLKACAIRVGSEGLVGSADKIKTNISILQAHVWLDAFPTKFVSIPSVDETVKAAKNFYSERIVAAADGCNHSLSVAFALHADADSFHLCQAKATEALEMYHELHAATKISSDAQQELDLLQGKVLAWSISKNEVIAKLPVVSSADLQNINNCLGIAGILQAFGAEAGDGLLKFKNSVEVKLQLFRGEIEGLFKEPGELQRKQSLLEDAETWAGLLQVRPQLPSVKDLRKQTLDHFVDRAEKLQNRIKDPSEEIDLDALEEQLSNLEEMTSHFNLLLDGACLPWTSALRQSLEARKADLEKRFEQYLDNNEYHKIGSYLTSLKNGGLEIKYCQCLKVLSVRLQSLVDAVSKCIPLPPSTEITRDSTKVKNYLKLIEAAEQNLSFVDSMPPVSDGGDCWKLQGLSSRIQTDLVQSLDSSLHVVGESVSKTDFVCALVGMEHCLFLQEICCGGPAERVLDQQKQVDLMFVKFNHSVDRFVTALYQEKVWSEPNTDSLHRSLTSLQLSACKDGCPEKILKTYTGSTNRLSIKLNELHAVLQQEREKGQFTRSIRVYGFLKKELITRGMNVHLNVGFDANAALEKVGTEKEAHELRFRNARLDKPTVDEIASKLEQKSRGFVGRAWNRFWFGKDDYEQDCNNLSQCVQEHTRNLVRSIENQEFSCLRDHVASFQYARDKLQNHLKFRWNLEKDLLAPVRSVLHKFLSEVSSALQMHSYDTLQQNIFPHIQELLESFSLSQATLKRAGLLDDFDKMCILLKTKINESLCMHLQSTFRKFNTAMCNSHIGEMTLQARRLKECGFFFLTSFELYTRTCCVGMTDKYLLDTSELVREKFGTGRISRIGCSLVLLDVLPSSSQSDISRSYRRLSRLYHPDKRPNDKYAEAKCKQINEAKEMLSDRQNLRMFQTHDLKFLSEAVADIPFRLRKSAKSLLDTRDYRSMVLMLENVEGLTQLHLLLTNQQDSTDVKKLKGELVELVKGQENKLTIGIDQAHSSQDFVELHHLFTNLEEFENVFRCFSGVVNKSATALVLGKLSSIIDKLKTDGAFLSGKPAHFAMSSLQSFGRYLLQLGRFYDGFPRLKDHARSAILSLFYIIKTQPWGYQFILDLGLSLENGSLYEDQEDQRVGRVIAGAFDLFDEVRTVVFNSETAQADIWDSIKSTKAQCCNKNGVLRDVNLDQKVLKEECEKYEAMHKQLVLDFVKEGPNDLVRHVLATVQELKGCSVKGWGKACKPKIAEILAGIFATFTIIKSGESFLKYNEHTASTKKGASATIINAENFFFKPHSIQILAVLRLLGIGSNDQRLENHIMEVRTGEGKSIILGALATILTLLGFTVKCVCYSEHLSERDNELFKDVFAAFGVVDRVKYSMITTMSEDTVADKGNIRRLTVDLLNGNLRRSKKKLKQDSARGSEVAEHLWTDENQALDNVAAAADVGLIEANDAKCNINRSVPPAPLPLNGEDILLVDEVDVFFGPEFYGNTHNMSVEFGHSSVAKLMRKIWNHRSLRPTFSAVSAWPEYGEVMLYFDNKWSQLVETHVRMMCCDVQNVQSPAYEVDQMNCRVGYRELDSVNWHLCYGYKTAFAYLQEQENGNFSGDAADKAVSKRLSLSIPCGSFSYASIEPTAVLGVTGTLKALTNLERTIVRNEFRIGTFSFLPSIYGCNNLEFDQCGRGITVEQEPPRHMQEIANAMMKATKDGRSAIAFFEDDKKLLAFQKSPHWKQFRTGNVLLSTTKKEDRKYVINKAATSQQVTIATAVFGRGTDFFCKDTKLESKGGMLVIQTFLSVEKSEELQTQGRTARQGKTGSYCMILLESDLTAKFQIPQGHLSTMAKAKVYETLDHYRKKVHTKALEENKAEVAKAAELDKLSHSYLDALVDGDKERATALFRKIPGAGWV